MFSFFPKNDYKQTLRIKRFLIAFAAYSIWYFISVFTFLMGLTLIQSYVLVCCLLGILICNILIYAMIRTGFNKRFKDPSLTLLQMLIATFWTMVVLYYAASARSIVLLLYLVIFVFGLFRLKVREFLFMSLFAVFAYATVILLLYQNHPESINWEIDALNLLVLAMVLPWFSLVGGYITRLRTRVAKALSNIKETELKFRTIFDSASDGIILLNVGEGKFSAANEKICNMLGYTNEELLKLSIYDLHPQESITFVTDQYEKILKKKALIAKNIPVIKKDKTVFFADISGSTITLGEKEYSIGMFRDISERKQAEEEINKLASVVRFSSELVNLATFDGKMIFLNEAGSKILGIDPDKVGNYSIMDVISEQFLLTVRQELIPTLLAGNSWEGELQYRNVRTGQLTDVYAMTFNIKDDVTGVPFCLANVSYDITERKLAEVKLQQTLESLKKAFGTIIQVMASAVEMKDPYTAGHQIRAADIAVTIAEEMGLNQEKIDGIRMSATIHDIGKLSVPAELLSKPTKLTDIEFTLIKEHSHSGYEMLKNVESPWPLAEIIHQHHERMNGTGYPRNLKGDEILIEARILAVADVVEAMASHRPYRAALGIEVALEEIEKNKGILYDVVVADACLRLFREKSYQFK